MTKDYRKEWGPIDAVREIVQNCLDNKEQPSTYVLGTDGTITITTKNFTLPMKYFAMGQSYKTANAIGGFGEGFKLAMLILQREECAPYIMNDAKVITPAFQRSELLDLDLFSLVVDSNNTHNADLTFVVQFPLDLIEELKQKVNVFSDNILPLPNGVDLLEEHPGQVFVNGLWVCAEDNFKYGYNFAPNRLSLGCDRQIASSFGMAWETSQYWAKALNNANKQEVLVMMTEGLLDVLDIHHHLSSAKAKLITEAFVERFGAVTIKQMGSNLSYGASVGGSVYSAMTKSGYANVANKWAEPAAPYQLLKEFMDTHGSKVRREFKVKFTTMLEQAKKWKVR